MSMGMSPVCPSTQHNVRSNSRGNILFLILIAVVLFAALSYAITQATRNSPGSPHIEKAIIAAAQHTQLANMIEQTIVRLRLSHGCTPEEISFAGHNDTSFTVDGTPYDYTNPSSPVDGSCNVFSPAGGGAVPPLLNKQGLVDPALIACGHCLSSQSWFVTPMRVLNMGTDIGAAGTDLVMWLGRPNRAQCLQINEKIGIPNLGGEPPTDTFDCADSAYNGTYGVCNDPLGDSAPELRAQKEFCVHWGSNWGMEGYVHLYVLLSR